jgi:hypothetical protein
MLRKGMVLATPTGQTQIISYYQEQVEAAFMKLASSLAFLLILLCSVTVLAGPPFQTDDPDPIDFRNFEFYTFASADGTGAEMDTAGPAAEFNWGALPNVHLHIVLPLAAILPANNMRFAPAGMGPSAIGLGDMEAGIKFRFVQETKRRPQIGTFVMFELPTGSVAKGLGLGRTWYKVPIWVQKSFGPWTTYGGGGEVIYNRIDGYRNHPFAGWLVQREMGKKLTLGSELFYHGAGGPANPQSRSAMMLDVGGYYKFRDPGFQLLFCYGHMIAGQSENYAYLALYWTWGHKEPSKDSASAMNRLGPPIGPGRL